VKSEFGPEFLSTLALPLAQLFFWPKLPQLNRTGQTYLPDPFGNIMPRYAEHTDPTGIKKYLNRVLTRSKADNP